MHPALRREELLDRAQALILQRGYDNVSLNEIIAAAGVSKGAFYHYFPAKDALLEALAERFARQALERIRSIPDVPERDALGRLNAFLARGRQDKVENAGAAWALFEAMFRAENLVLFHRINAAVNALLLPILADMIRDGVRDGVFDTFDPEGAADMILQIGTSTRGIVARALASADSAGMEVAITALERRVRLYEIALDRVLGLEDGSLRLAESGHIRMVMEARHAGRGETPA